MTAKKFYFILIGLIVLSFAAVAGVYFLGSGKLEEESKSVAVLKAERDVSQEAIVKLKKAKTDSKDIDEVVGILDRLLPREKQQDKLIADVIYTATAEAGISFNKIISFSFEGGSEPDSLSGTNPSKENPGVFEYPFNLTINDISYETLLNLLKEIETNGRIIQVDNIGISSNDLNSNVNVQLSMKAYVKQ